MVVVIPDGLHQAIEAKENVKLKLPRKPLQTVTLQNYSECTAN
jgi:preprotein translocase subunit SecA